MAPRLEARLALVLTIGAVVLSAASAQAAPDGASIPARPARQSTSHTWWLVSRALNRVICVIVIGHEGEPTFEELADSCGVDLAQEWQESPSCPYDPTRMTPCPGLYLRPGDAGHAVQASTSTARQGHPLWLDLPGCSRARANWVCDSQPILRITAEDTDSSDPPTAILALVGSETTKCPGAACDVPLEPTPTDGLEITFWSSLASGDVSQKFGARVRVAEQGRANGVEWKVDLLSTQIKDDWMDRCALAWDALPAEEGRPSWLDIPDEAEELWTSETYTYLEERLAMLGLQAEAAPGDGGLFAPAERIAWTSAGTLMEAWQNQFDAAIIEAASARGLPPRVLKGLFAAKNQFWPGSFPEVEEVGLGQLSQVGADTLLLWSPPFFTDFCPQVLHPDSCDKGYSRMPEAKKTILRAALLGRVNAECSDCTYGLDLAKAEGSVPIFAESLNASCSQTGRMVYNVTGDTPSLASTYEDLWRLTLGNYNAGSGCMAKALKTTWQKRHRLDWAHVAENLPEGCQRAVDYISRVLGESPVVIPAEGSADPAVNRAGG